MTKISRAEWLGINDYQPLDWVLTAVLLAAAIAQWFIMIRFGLGHRHDGGSFFALATVIAIAGRWLLRRRKSYNAIRSARIAAFQLEKLLRTAPPPLPAGPRKRSLSRPLSARAAAAGRRQRTRIRLRERARAVAAATCHHRTRPPALVHAEHLQ